MAKLNQRKIITIFRKDEKIIGSKVLQRCLFIQRRIINQNFTIDTTEIQISLWNMLTLPANPQQPLRIGIHHIPNTVLTDADNNKHDCIINVIDNNLLIGSIKQRASSSLLEAIPKSPLIEIIAVPIG